MAGPFWPAGTNVINTLLFLQVAQHSCFYVQNKVVVTRKSGPALPDGPPPLGESGGRASQDPDCVPVGYAILLGSKITAPPVRAHTPGALEPNAALQQPWSWRNLEQRACLAGTHPLP